MTITLTWGVVCLTALGACLGGCGDGEQSPDGPGRGAAPPAAEDVRVADGYRIVGTPIAAVAATGRKTTTANVTLRTSRALPRRDGAVAATIRLDGVKGASPPVRAGARGHRCYVQSIDPFPRRAQPGGQARVTVTIRGIERALGTTVTLTSPRETLRRFKRLCGVRRLVGDPDAVP